MRKVKRLNERPRVLCSGRFIKFEEIMDS